VTLSPGTRLGPYEVQSAIGAGGMGEVYKARDTRLDRSVAIKVLPRELGGDPDRRARFEREAKTIAGLNHPHICALFDVGETMLPGPVSVSFLVMEHLVGETLTSRLAKGPLPLDDALEVGAQIADALAVAHKQGIIHRDLKPGNVMLTKTGAKLLDFGLAKLRAPGVAPGADFSSLPTQAAPETEKGTILGTLAYMAPEQLEGKEADAHSDLFSFGAVLYEMLTGKRAFEGASPASVISAVMSSQPPSILALKPLTPPVLDRLVRQCLAKVPDERPDSAHDVANDLRWLRETSGIGALPGLEPRHGRVARVALFVAAALAMAIVGAGLMWLLRPSAPAASLAGVSLTVQPAEEVNGGGVWPALPLPTPAGSRTALTWTPDGTALVFVGRRSGVQHLYVRRLDSAEARPLPNTEGATVPAVSADGQWVAFWSGGAIRKVPLGGGPAMDLAPGISTPPWGLAWDVRGRLYFGREDGRIWTIPPDGTPSAVTTVGEGEVGHTLPWPLPGGQALLYTVRNRLWTWGDEKVVLQRLSTGAREVLLTNAADARYLPTGHLVFLRGGVLYAVPFDAERLEIRGTPVAVLENVVQAIWEGGATADVTGAGQFAVSATGALAWIPGPVVPYPDAALVTLDRQGKVTPLPTPVRGFVGPVRLSPDGRRLAVAVKSLSEAGVWVYDLEHGTLPVQTGVGEAAWTVWSRDGQRLVFDWLAEGRPALASQPADGTAPPQVLVPRMLYPSSVTPDGDVLVVAGRPGNLMGGHIAVVTVENGHGRVQTLVETSHTESWPAVSPDGHWLAYGSDVSGRNEVYVRPYPGPGGIKPVSVDGGGSPAWHPNGRELFFVAYADPAGPGRMMTVDFVPGPPIRVGQPRVLFEYDDRTLYLDCSPVRCYDVSSDGQRFYTTQFRMPPNPPPVTHINLIQNWFEELKGKVPRQ
jgi:Tol biopolymer transport system component